jgi:sec-independent protein translocase protein TatA
MPLGIAWWEILLILLLVLLVFGPKRLPEMGRSLGKGFREFKDSITGESKDEPQDEPQDELQGELPPADTADDAEPAPAPRERDRVT